MRDGARVRGSYTHDDKGRPRWEPNTKLIAEYDYYRPDASYSYTVRRGQTLDGEKVFTTGRRNTLRYGDRLEPDEKRDWLPGMGGEAHTLYRSRELSAASPSELVFVAEGEKDADNLAELGLVATTNSSGARKWTDDYSRLLAGRDVVILPDNDEIGREHAEMVVASALPHARSVRVVELPDLPPNGDVSNFLEEGNGKTELLELVAATPPITPNSPWVSDRRDFSRDANGRPHQTLGNARIALTRLGVVVRFDEFAGRFLVEGLPGFGPHLDDAALTRMRLQAEARWSLRISKDRWCDIVTDQARENTFHPVRAYLESLEWDGTERLDKWLHSYAGAEDSAYVRAVGGLALTAAVRRVRQPGCKFDEMLVLESGQGTGKSTALSILSVNDEWFADDLPLDSDSKVVMERTAGRWIVELAELKGMRRGDTEHVKAMVSRRVDKARLAYGRLTTEQPRQCVFFGTTNDDKYLRDMTGNRRFLPVRVSSFDLEGLRRDRDQLWAEAAARESRGEPIRLPESLWALAGDEQSRRLLEDPFHEILSERLEGKEGKVRSSDIWDAVGLTDPGRRTPDHNMRLSAVMQSLGWQRPKSKVRFDGQPQRAWVKGDPPAGGYKEVRRTEVIAPDDGRPL